VRLKPLGHLSAERRDSLNVAHLHVVKSGGGVAGTWAEGHAGKDLKAYTAGRGLIYSALLPLLYDGL
jgi:hypothetical protein